MTDFTIDERHGLRILTAAADAPRLPDGGATRCIIEACFSHDADVLLLHAATLPSAFLDLSSGLAGELLQQLQMYGGRRLAVVHGPGDPAPSRRFVEMEGEARQRGRFGLFATVDAAHAWLTLAGA